MPLFVETIFVRARVRKQNLSQSVRRAPLGGAGERGFGSMASRPRRRGSTALSDAPSNADEFVGRSGVGSLERGNTGGCEKILITGRGATLVERRIDSETTEYTVKRTVRSVLWRSSLPGCCMFVGACAAFETVMGKHHVTYRSIEFGSVCTFSIVAVLVQTLRVISKTTVSESILVMKHVGVRLSSTTLLPVFGTRETQFLDVDTLRSVVIHEAVRAKKVLTYVCFRFNSNETSCEKDINTSEKEKDDAEMKDASPGNNSRTTQDRRVVLVFPAIRPGLAMQRRVYGAIHDSLFARGDDEKENELVESNDSLQCLPGPAQGHGWWRGSNADSDTNDDTENTPSTSTSCDSNRRESILMVSDFFLPNLGGVELHMFSLAQCLMRRGHKVTVLTHAYGDRCGVRYMTNGLKVYYAFRVPVYNGATCPDIFGNFKLLREILLREKVTVVHAHQAFSVMGHEAIFHARTMGYKCVFTDHSLFGFSDTSAIHMNKLLVLTLSDCNHVICVSHTAKENTVLRSGIPPTRVSVVPNAVDAVRFVPDLKLRGIVGGIYGGIGDDSTQNTSHHTQKTKGKTSKDRVVVAVTARLAYRKGVHLLSSVIPLACETFPQVDFLITGDGPMRPHLEQMVVEHGLTKRVTLLGNVPHSEIVFVLQRAHVFLNCSLTESFCIAILEAACCGCLVVATRVGGVPEVLPPDLLFLAEPCPAALVEALRDAIGNLKKSEKLSENDDGKNKNSLSPIAIHTRVKAMYSWMDVAERVEVVYNRAHATRDTMAGRFARLRTCGAVAGFLFVAVAAVDYLYWRLLEIFSPGREIDAAPEYVPDGEEEEERQGR